MAVWITAITLYTSTFAVTYAAGDKPRDRSRAKMARSPARSRIVSAVPMITAAMVSNASSSTASSGPSPNKSLLPKPV